MKSIYLLLIVIFIGCQNQDQQQNLVKENVIRDFLKSELVLKIKNRGNKVFIFKNDYCEKVDCEAYFKGFEEEVVFIAKEDVFMRGLHNYLIIKKIDEQNSIIEAKEITIRGRRK